MIGAGRQHGPVGNDHGWALLQCDVCKATWHGTPGQTCSWCVDDHQRQRDGQRDLLLYPPWAGSDAGNQRYDDLTAVDQAVWRRTRGQHGDVDAVDAWIHRLGVAIASGLISSPEAAAALRRVAR